MTWLALSLLAAFSLASADALTKGRFGHLGAYEMGLIRLTYTLPWLVISMFFIPWTWPDRTFFVCLACALPLEALAFICYMRAIRTSPLSLCLPLLAFTPLFMIMTAWLLLGEALALAGIVGIVLIVAGSYCLNLSRIEGGLLEPFRAILSAQGPRLMLLAAFLYSLTSSLGKLAILHSNACTFAVVYFTAFTVLMFLLMPLAPRVSAHRLTRQPLSGLALGALMALMIFSHMLAISQVQAAYMIAIKRTSMIFGVLYGALIFREEQIRERFLGAVIMLLGACFIASAA